MTHGDVAIGPTQYSYLPSWLSYLVDRSRAASNAETLITALRVELDSLPADQRPELYVFGESLGAFSTDNAFTSVEDMSTTTDGALLIGPPSFDPTWQKVVAGRQPGSPVWRPLYGDGGLVRVATTASELTDQTLTWTTDNPIIYLTHASDPIVAWTADHQAWLDPRGPDVSPRVVAWPVVGGWQATVDQFNANGVPPGHGHVYDSTVVTAWSEIVGPPSLPDDRDRRHREGDQRPATSEAGAHGAGDGIRGIEHDQVSGVDVGAHGAGTEHGGAVGHPAQPVPAPPVRQPTGPGRHHELDRHVGQWVGAREREEVAGVVADGGQLGHGRLELGRLAVRRRQGAVRVGGCLSGGATDEHDAGGEVRRDPRQPGAAGHPGGPGRGRPAELQAGGLELGVGGVDEHQAAHQVGAGARQALGEQSAVRVAHHDHRVGRGLGVGGGEHGRE